MECKNDKNITLENMYDQPICCDGPKCKQGVNLKSYFLAHEGLYVDAFCCHDCLVAWLTEQNNG